MILTAITRFSLLNLGSVVYRGPNSQICFSFHGNCEELEKVKLRQRDYNLKIQAEKENIVFSFVIEDDLFFPLRKPRKIKRKNKCKNKTDRNHTQRYCMAYVKSDMDTMH